jgi:hypothetical protein
LSLRLAKADGVPAAMARMIVWAHSAGADTDVSTAMSHDPSVWTWFGIYNLLTIVDAAANQAMLLLFCQYVELRKFR